MQTPNDGGGTRRNVGRWHGAGSRGEALSRGGKAQQNECNE
ncbi:hypothetical protein KAM376D_44840 [Aeromonas caviae]|nr:hypothetical protein KAM376D_44840 [Aeromonas caviae]